MEYYQNTLCVTRTELVQPGILSDSYLKKLVREDKADKKRLGGNGRECLIAYDSLPLPVKDKLRKVYGDDMHKQALQSPLLKYYENDVKAFDFFDTHKMQNGARLKDSKIREYTNNANALNAIIRLMNHNRTLRKSLGGISNTNQLYKDFIIPSLQTFKVQWGHTLPSGERRLREIIKDYQQSGYEALISGKLANENAAKIVENEQHAMLRKLLSHANNFDNAQVMMMYNEVAAINGWKNVTRRTVENFAEKNRLYTEPGRRGEVQFDNTMAMQTKRRGPKYPMLMWSIDGWDVELLYQQSVINKDGHSVTTYHNRVNIVVILDPFTKYPLGYAIGTHETPELIRSAVRNALNHTAELFGCRHRPQQIQTDRYAIATLTPFFESITPRYVPAKRKNAKTKPIEPYFKDLNKNYCQFLNNWSGFGATAKTDNQPNIEYRNKIRHSFPDYDGVMAQITNIIETERAKKKENYINGWKALPDSYYLPWNTEQYLYYAGERKERTSRMRGEGMVFDINRTERQYDCFEKQWRMHQHMDWTIKYDLEDMSTVLAVNDDGSLRFLLEEKYIQPMTLVERSDGDAKELARIAKYNKDLKQEIMKRSEADYDIVSELFENPDTKDTLSKMLLVNSLGQHKNQKNEGRELAAAGKALAEKQQRKEIAQAVAADRTEYEKYLDSKININDYL